MELREPSCLPSSPLDRHPINLHMVQDQVAGRCHPNHKGVVMSCPRLAEISADVWLRPAAVVTVEKSRWTAKEQEMMCRIL